MASVFRGTDKVLDRDVAVKILHPHLQILKESKTRFEREAKAIAKLHHSNILQIYDYSGLESSPSFIVMELIQGPTLRRFLEEHNSIPVEIGALIVSEVCKAVEHAHQQGIIHRDIKPENIMITLGGAIKLTDFGIAQLAGLSEMTVTGQILGSPAYMSPEHIEGKTLDSRADIFSIGTLLYQLLTGRLPFHGSNPHVVMKRISEGSYMNPLQVNPAVGEKLAEVINRSLKSDREQRYQKVEDMRVAIEAVLDEIGNFPPEETLAAYFDDPAVFSEQHRRRMVARLMEMGTRAQQKKQHRESLDAYNRLLAIEPGNEEALSRVAGINNRKRIRRYLERLTIAATVVILAGALLFTFYKTASSVTIPEPRNKSSVTKPIPSSAVKAKYTPSSKKKNKKKKTKSRSKAKKSTPKQIRMITFHPQPPSVDIYVDGRMAGTYGPSFNKMALSVGEHSIKFAPRDPECCFEASWKVKVPPGNKPYRIGRSLKWKPAKLLVNSNTPANVVVADHGQTRTGMSMSIPIKRGPEKRVSIEVIARGHMSVKKDLTLRAGKTTSIDVNLRPIGGV